MNIKKVAVIGAGVMGTAIAAQIANAGVPVYLLDIVPNNDSNRNKIAQTALELLAKAEPPALMLKSNIKLITPGNIEDHLSCLSEVDWIIEAIIEKLDIKQDLYRKLAQACRPEVLISSNTSTLPLAMLAQGMPLEFRRRFMITHFFNPPRYMRLLELVRSDETLPELYQAVAEFADAHLGKDCIACHDAPGFIANRIGTFWLQCGVLEAMRLGVSVEAADALLGEPIGMPKTGVFGLADLVGIDLLPHVLANMAQSLPESDAFHSINHIPPLVQNMIATGYSGRKGKGGFYRLQESSGKRIKEALDLQTGEYHPAQLPALEILATYKEKGLQGLLGDSSIYGIYAWQVMSRTLNYAAGLIPEIADDVYSVDQAFHLGFNWRYGPFELLDKIGVEWYVSKLQAENCTVPPLLNACKAFYRIEQGQRLYSDVDGVYKPMLRPQGVLSLADIKLQAPPVLDASSASVWDIGDGVACLEFHSKMNTLDGDILSLIQKTLEIIKQGFSALVIYSEAEHFSAGANLNALVNAIEHKNWDTVAYLVGLGQQTFKALKYSPFPVVGAPSGFALGGGCEVLLHCDAIQAHAELYMGLVETGVGLIPGWGGCKEYLRRVFSAPKRLSGPLPPLAQAFETIAMAKVSKSAFEARVSGFLADSDGISMNRSRLLADAKAKALALLPNYQAPKPMLYSLPGKSGFCALDMQIKALRLAGKISAYDAKIGEHLAEVLSGGDCDMMQVLTEDDIHQLELQAFVDLTKNPETLARLHYLLKTGKPLRN
jgi:3-hydroxyacyl-CoA dehydrogenase